ncbi:MAG: segregation/condensation protein A [archaeon]|nr:segregation/condensation protein A [archaeon]MCR4323481.1 segregation/condensation protein A [Nanoarchaeota archaeon]
MEREERLGQDQFFDMITRDELGWQAIIYDLIKTEQLDPWDIDIGILADKYVGIIQQLEDADFFISSKVLLACSLLLRLKSEILVNSYIVDLNEALYGRVEKEKYELERIEIDENELPILIPRTPMARHRKVTLEELMSALNKAVDTENRRIKREIKGKQAAESALTVMPKGTHIPLKIRVKNIFGLVKFHMGKGNDHMKFSELAQDREEKLASFVPVLHLANDGKIFIRQPIHFEEIHLGLKMHPDEVRELAEEIGLAEINEESEE